MQITIAQITPFLAKQTTGSDTVRVGAWLGAISAALTARYGEVATALLPLVHSYTADAVSRRLQPRDRLVAQQSVGPASIRYTEAAGLGGYFLPEELADLDRTIGVAGTRSYRTAAPAGVRYGNWSGPDLGDVLESDYPIQPPEE
jgi:hypothetical protein